MKRAKQFALWIGTPVVLYLILPLAIFDFSSPAYPYDEEYFAGQYVAIGPRPRWWVPGAAHRFDIPGGFDYEPSGWPFVLWKPLCVAYVKNRGYALPYQWRPPPRHLANSPP